MKRLMKFLPLLNKLSTKTNPNSITIVFKNPKNGATAKYTIDANVPILGIIQENSNKCENKFPDSLSINDLIKMSNEGTIELKDITVD